MFFGLGDARQSVIRDSKRGADRVTALAALFETHKFGASFGEDEWADMGAGFKTVHGSVDRRDGNRRTGAAIHAFVQMAKNDAGRWEQRIRRAHNLNHGKLDISI